MSPSLTAAQIREAFLAFFEGKLHRRISSSSLVPSNDPTLLFVNAGMVQFKDVFTGREVRDYKRATTTQKCVRAGGKHNDLDNVGFTARHHTFFEMLGNFSFGDYFKQDAIAWAWEFVTQVLKLPVGRLSVTVFKGEDGIPADEEAFELWAKTGVPRERIRRLGLKDNFWAMGDTGACGPCSEIYFYMPDGPVNPNEHAGESDNWLEIWNLVFMQFERKVAGGPLTPLPKPSIDTGAGLERVASVVQGKKSNYDIDLFEPLLAKAALLSGKKYGATDALPDVAMRVIADHARATAFLVTDGVQPSNEGRGYVLRRIMRRAIRHGEENLGLNEPFFHEAVDSVVSAMSVAYPQLHEKRDFLLEVVRHEEASFRRTLKGGRGLIEQELSTLKAKGQKLIPGAIVWDLHQTFGFPWDLTQVIARENGFEIDQAGFEKLLEEERVRASQGSLSSTSAIGDAYMKLANRLPETTFLGYDATTGQGKVVAILKKGVEVEKAAAGDEVEVILDASPFYGESGGQLGDTGSLSKTGVRREVTDVQKPAGGLLLHAAKVAVGAIALGDSLEASVDDERRNKIRANHSATHLLHKALKVVLGAHVNQKGSIVGPDVLRFDFSHFSPVTPEQLETLEDLVNGWVRENADSQTKVMNLADAKAAGAVALFGEKYGDSVRVVTVHPQSTELCGGTHVRRSGDIGLFKITQESSIASGVRRVVALTGHAAVQATRQFEKQLRAASDLFKATPADLGKRIESTQKLLKELEKKIENLQVKAQSGGGVGGGAETIQDINGIKVLTRLVDEADANLLKQLSDKFREKFASGIIGLGGTTSDGKAIILVTASDDVIKKGFKSGDAMRVMAPEVGGKGGGKPESAQGGGTDPSKIPAAFEKLFELVRRA